jgi:NAD(P)-dependent dehydrogenase (short-subunit alcohol dehydrogenase family)
VGYVVFGRPFMTRYLITGATRGIGRALVELLAPDHELIVVGRSPEALAPLPAATRVVLDLADPPSFASALPPFDRLDGVVHCAGIVHPGRVDEQDVTAWNEQFTVNVVAAAELTRLLLPALRAAGGSVVFVNSGSGQRARAGLVSYGASKFALRAMADGLREEEPELRVTSVYPGRTATDMQRMLRAYEHGDFDEAQYLRPSTVAAVIAQVLATPADGVVTDVTVRPR